MKWFQEFKDVLRRYDDGDRSDDFWEELSIVRRGPPTQTIQTVAESAHTFFTADTTLQVLIARLRLKQIDEQDEEFHQCMLELLQETKETLLRRHKEWLQRPI
jgi:hypothetical protein